MSLVSELRILLDDTGTFWTDNHIYDALNEALLEAHTKNNWIISTANWVVPADGTFITLPTSIMIPMKIVGTAGELYPSGFSWLEADSREWGLRETSEEPEHFVLWDAETLIPYPTPTSTHTLRIVGVPWPTEITSTSTDITAEDRIKRAIVYRAASSLIEHTLPDWADQYSAEADKYEYEHRVNMRRRGYPRLDRLRPGTTFTRRKWGSIGKDSL